MKTHPKPVVTALVNAVDIILIDHQNGDVVFLNAHHLKTLSYFTFYILLCFLFKINLKMKLCLSFSAIKNKKKNFFLLFFVILLFLVFLFVKNKIFFCFKMFQICSACFDKCFFVFFCLKINWIRKLFFAFLLILAKSKCHSLAHLQLTRINKLLPF